MWLVVLNMKLRKRLGWCCVEIHYGTVLWDEFGLHRTQAPVVQKLDSAVNRKNRYPMAKFYKNYITLSNG